MTFIEEMRQTMAASDRRRDKDLKIPKDIEQYRDILYGSDKQWQILDLYRPLETKDKELPVIINVHGGGWVYGDKELYQYYGMNLAQRGFAVINFTYRLAPEHRFPAQLEDINLVFHWLLKNASNYQLNTNNLFAVGDSAGAHLLSLYVTYLNSQVYNRFYAFDKPEQLALKAIALNAGIYQFDLKETKQDKQTKKLLHAFLSSKHYYRDLKKISVLDKIKPNFPPTFITTSVADFLRSESLLLAATLTEKEIEHSYHLYGSKENQLKHVFHLNILDQSAITCNDDTIAFFKKYMD